MALHRGLLLVTAALLSCGHVRSAVIRDYPDNLGTEFHLMFLENALASAKAKSLPVVIFITNPNDAAVSVTIETPGFLNGQRKPQYKETKSIAAGTLESFELPANVRVVGTTKTQKAIVIKSTGAIAVTGSNQEQFSTGAFLGLPLDVLDTEYYGVCWHTPRKRSQIGIVSPTNNNKVEITVGPGGEVEYESKDYNAGDTFTVTLSQYETFQIQSKSDLTGTFIKASSKVALFSGNIKVGVMPTKNSPIDHVVEMIVPVSRWGKDFITSPIPERTTGDAFTFVASEDNTEINIYGISRTTKTLRIAKKGGSLTELINSNKYTLVKSNKAIMVAQFVLSEKANEFGTNKPSTESADPAMVLVPPIQQYAADYTVSTLKLVRTNANVDYTNYFLIAVKDEDKDGIMLDGKSLEKSVKWTAIPGTKYVGTNVKVTPGVHRVNHQNPTKTYIAVLYGSIRAEAYAFPTGFRMAPINPCQKTTTSLEGDGLDNDCDGLIDEEFCYEDGIKADDDGDGLVDEDCVKVPANYIRPVKFTGSSSTSSSIQIRYNPPTKGPKPEAYEFYAYVTSQGYKANRLVKTIHDQASTYSVSLTGLDADTEYTIIVAARLNGSQARADNLIKVKTLSDRLEVKDPKLTVSMNQEKTKLMFKLMVEALTDNTQQYVVTWYNQGAMIKTVAMEAGRTSITLSQDELKKRGLGMSVLTKSLSMVEGGEAGEIKIRSNAPPSLLCNNTAGACSSLRVLAQQVNSGREYMHGGKAVMQAAVMLKDTEVAKAFCGVEITPENWHEEQSILMKAKLDGLFDGTQERTFAVGLHQRVRVNNLQVESKAALQNVQVSVTDTDSRAVCQSLCDPHLRTFDGAYYDNHFEGEFVLYKHKTLPYAVHARYTKCFPNSRVTCNCGVAVMIDDDVIVVDSCSDKRGPMALLMYKNGELTPGTRVYNPSTKYLISLPTGARVTVSPVKFGTATHLNIYIKPSYTDITKSQGLCGDFNKKSSDDFTLPDGTDASQQTGSLRPKFSSYWRVGKKESIFNGVCASQEKIKTAAFCDCTGDPKTERCDAGVEAKPFTEFTAGGLAVRDITETLVKNGRSPKPYIQCGTADTVDETAEIMLFDTQDKVKMRMKTSWTEEKAQQHCVAFMKKNAAVARCERIMKKEDYDAIIGNCVKDILATDSTDWSQAARESIKQLCLLELKSNVKLWVEQGGVMKMETAIAGLICADDCSGHGTCTKGVCECDKGYIGDDCSLREGVKPAINAVQVASCDRNKADAVSHVTLFGDGFTRSDKLECLAQAVKTNDQKTLDVGAVVKSKAVFLSKHQVACAMKTCSDFHVAVGSSEKVKSDKVQAVTKTDVLKKATLRTQVTNKKMSFECSFKTDGNPTTLYTVHWYNMDVKIKTATVNGDAEGKVILSEDDLTKRGYGTTVQCRVVACQRTSCDATRGVVVMSKKYRAAIEMTPKDLTVVESGEEKMAEFKLAASPGILCPAKDKKCRFRITGVQHQVREEFKCQNRYPISQAVIRYDGGVSEAFCGVHIDTDDWEKTQSIPVKAKADGRYDGEQSRKFSFYLNTAVEGADGKFGEEERTIISAMQVKAEDRDKKGTCKCTNDPHITTLDGSYFNNHMEGEFVLYKHTNYDQAVHMFFKKCVGVGSNRASCNCAAAIKSGDDVILFDSCDNKRKKADHKFLRIVLYKNGDLTPGTYVERVDGGVKFKVYLPTGTVVTIKPHDGPAYLNIWISAGSADYGKVQGLCGNFDGDSKNDFKLLDGTVISPSPRQRFVTKFSQMWQIERKNSIYTGVCEKEATRRRKVYCDCASSLDKPMCGVDFDSKPCASAGMQLAQEKTKKSSTKDITDILVKKAKEPEMCKEKADKEKFLLEFDDKVEEDAAIKVTNNDFTVEKSREACRKYISGKKSGRVCSSVVGEDAQTDVEGCSQDLAMTNGNEEWLKTALESVKEQCAIELERNVTYLVKAAGEMKVNAAILGEICPNECSGNGDCKDGACVCKTGFISPDCSVKKTTPPQAMVAKRGCADGQCFATVMGMGFVESEKLNCVMQEVELKDGKIVRKSGTLSVRKAEFVSRYEVQCDADEKTSYVFRISNDGTAVPSKEIFSLVAKTACWDCDTNTGVCKQEKDTCFIRAKCIKKGEANPDNEAETCNPEKSKTSWSTKLTCVTMPTNKIVNGVVENTNIRANGGASVVTEDGSNVIELNGNRQFLELEVIKDTCLADLSRCKKGFTIILPIKFRRFRENMYFLSSGGEKRNTQGLSVVYRYGRLWFQFTTATKAWYAYVDEKLEVNKWYRFEVTFTESKGVAIYSAGNLVKTVTRTVNRTSTPTQSGKVFIGRASSDQCTQEFADVRLERVQMCEATRERLLELGIATGPSTIPPPTTTLPPAMPPLPAECRGRPDVPFKPVLGVTFTDESADDVKITCSIPSTSSTIQFGVNWYIDDKQVHTEWIPLQSKSVTLKKSKFTTDVLSKGVYCTLTARYTQSECKNTRSRPRKSRVYKAELTVEVKDSITLEESGSEETVGVMPTAPPSVLCGIGGASIEIEVVVQKTTNELVCGKQFIPQIVTRVPEFKEMDVCGTQIESATWQMQQSFSLKGFADFKIDREQTREAWIYKKCVVDGAVKSSEKIKTVKVAVKDQDRIGQCNAVGDPHLKSFDNKYYNIYLEGEFILYQHSTLPYAFHSFYRKCGRAACNCAIAARAGDDVIIIDYCKQTSKTPRLKIRKYRNGDITKGLEIYKTKSGYELHLPSGTYVAVKLRMTRGFGLVMDLYVHASPSDWKKSTGLCGMWDGDGRNDLKARGKLGVVHGYSRFPDKFSLTWRSYHGGACLMQWYFDQCAATRECHAADTEHGTPPRHSIQTQGRPVAVLSIDVELVDKTESIYAGVEKAVPTPSTDRGRYCQCVGTKSRAKRKCGLNLDRNDCNFSEGVSSGRKITEKIREKVVGLKRATRVRRATAKEEFKYDANYVNPETTWPTKSGITIEKARAYCTEGLANSTALQKCANETSAEDQTEAINDCVADIGASDDLSWLKSTLETQKETCLTKATTDTSLYKKDAEGNLAPSTSLLSALCPNDCNEQGTCDNGKCTCKVGFIGDDCSQTDGPPEVEELEDDGLCDVRTETCTSVTVSGTNFHDIDTLTCHVHEVEMLTAKRIGEARSFKAEFITQDQVVCPSLEAAASYYVTVSNNGAKPATEKLRVAYDSQCYTCTSPDACSRNEQGCIIDGQCIKDGTISLLDSCKICNARRDKNDWSQRIDGDCIHVMGVSPQNMSVNTVTITAVVFSVALVLAVLATFCGVKKFYRKDKLPEQPLFHKTRYVDGSPTNARAWRADVYSDRNPSRPGTAGNISIHT